MGAPEFHSITRLEPPPLGQVPVKISGRPKVKINDSTRLSFSDVVKALSSRTILSARLHPVPKDFRPIRADLPYRLEVGISSFYIHRGPQRPELTFNEGLVATSSLMGDRLTMEDAQGFVFDLDLG